MYDLFFVSYEEPNADDNWNGLRDRFPHAKRIHGIKGIANAHRACAMSSYTLMFYTVDGDTVIDDSWNFDYVPPSWDQGYLHLWYSRNEVNDLSYGYGSVKLWPKNRILAHAGSWLDFTTSVGNIKIVDSIIATTRFNSSPFEAWKSAFRECVKLCQNVRRNPADMESRNRLKRWATVANTVPNSEWCVTGATDAIAWQSGKPSLQDLSFINDFDWLRDRFQRIAVSRS